MVWLTRNDMIFRNRCWVDIKIILRRMNRCLASWKPMLTATQEDGVNQWCNYLEETIRAPLGIGPS
jgi:hypothetical protein